MAQRGLLIVLEGCDRSGKTTQCKKLVEYLTRIGKKVELMKFPDRTTVIGRMISEYLNNNNNLSDAAIHLLFSANRWELAPMIECKLLKGVTLIVDRYAYSGVAYTNAKSRFTLDWCKQPDIGLPRPDAVIYLDVASDIARSRGNYGDERYETEDFQQKVSKSFSLLKDNDWTVLNAAQNIDDLHRDIQQTVNRLLRRDLDSSISKLWVVETS